MSEISDEEVDYGSSDIVGNPNIYLDYAWSNQGIIVKTKLQE